MRADEEVEAALRVSCFSFGPKGLKVMEAEPIPVAAVDEDEEGKENFQNKFSLFLFIIVIYVSR